MKKILLTILMWLIIASIFPIIGGVLLSLGSEPFIHGFIVGLIIDAIAGFPIGFIIVIIKLSEYIQKL